MTVILIIMEETIIVINKTKNNHVDIKTNAITIISKEDKKHTTMKINFTTRSSKRLNKKETKTLKKIKIVPKEGRTTMNVITITRTVITITRTVITITRTVITITIIVIIKNKLTTKITNHKESNTVTIGAMKIVVEAVKATTIPIETTKTEIRTMTEKETKTVQIKMEERKNITPKIRSKAMK